MDKPLLPKGHASILSPRFRYVPATHTDLARTFARIRQQLRTPARPSATVSEIKPRRSG
jgi:hypothetical protein